VRTRECIIKKRSGRRQIAPPVEQRNCARTIIIVAALMAGHHQRGSHV